MNMKKVVSLVLTVIMLITMSAAAFAAGEGKITINGTTSGKTYELYKIFDLKMAGTGNAGSIAYTIDNEWKNFFAAGGAGAEYIVTDAVEGLTAIAVDGVTKYINITEDNVAAFSKAAQAYALTNRLAADRSVVADATSEVITDLDLGYYLVYPQGASEIKEGNSCLCSLTSTVPEATVNIKAEYPTIDKADDQIEADKEDKADVQLGDVVNYTITGEVPDTTGYTTYTYTITDTMSDGLTFNNDIKLYIGNSEITNLVEDERITLTTTKNGFELTIKVMQFQQQIGAEIKVTYSATVNADAVANIENNSATLTYSNNPKNNEDKTTTPPDIEKVYSSQIKIEKVNEKDEALKGAKFVLMNNEQNKYYKIANNVVSWVDDIDEATVVVTEEDGTAYFKGLEDGTYYLKETEAPEGYNLLTGVVEVVVNGSAATEDNLTTLTAVKEVENKSGAVLPETGAQGTKVIYMAGGILVAAAAILLITKRRMNAAE